MVYNIHILLRVMTNMSHVVVLIDSCLKLKKYK